MPGPALGSRAGALCCPGRKAKEGIPAPPSSAPHAEAYARLRRPAQSGATRILGTGSTARRPHSHLSQRCHSHPSSCPPRSRPGSSPLLPGCTPGTPLTLRSQRWAHGSKRGVVFAVGGLVTEEQRGETEGVDIDLRGQTVGVLGLGVSGRAAVLLALARDAHRVIAYDTNTTLIPLEEDASFQASLAQWGIPAQGRLSTLLGPHHPASLCACSALVLSPGVPPTLPPIHAALASGVRVTSELAFAAECLPLDFPIAAVTGTNGKSTVTTFCGQLLSACGVHSFVGGNLGTPLSLAALHFLPSSPLPPSSPSSSSSSHAPIQHSTHKWEAAVVEVSSYQLQLSGGFRPRAAVILNLTADHMERHRTMEAYGAAKCRVFRLMGPAHSAILPTDDPLLHRLFQDSGSAASLAHLGALPGVVISQDLSHARVQLPGSNQASDFDLTNLSLLGSHNYHNAVAALLLVLSLGLPSVSAPLLQQALPSLAPPPHRMQLVHEDERGVQWINDSKATNVESTAAGVRGLMETSKRPLILLLGGIAKVRPGAPSGGFGFGDLAALVRGQRGVVTFGNDGEAIAEELQREGVDAVQRVATMRDAVHLAASQLALPGDCVVLSPGCASFDEFHNFEHRGTVFAHLARDQSLFASAAAANSSSSEPREQ